MNRIDWLHLTLVLSLVGLCSFAGAAGMSPQTTVVLINAGVGEGSMIVTNTDAQARLLYTSIENLPEDQEELLLVTAPIARVEAGQRQLVRFVVQATQPLTTQRMKRVIFEGIAPQDNDGKGKVAMTVRQNLAVIISPADLPAHDAPWTLLTWELKDRTLTVRNDSRYVVRLTPGIRLMPGDVALSLPRPYLLPGQSHRLPLPAGVSVAADSQVRLYPATLYGFQGALYDAPLIRRRSAP